jgi:hypothetical protein
MKPKTKSFIIELLRIIIAALAGLGGGAAMA